MSTLIRPAVTLFLLLSALTGLLYPAMVTASAQLLFPQQAEGSLLRQGAHTVGSSLIGQSFNGPSYFWGRPSATGPMPYNAAASSGSNYGPSNPALIDAVKARVATVRAAHPEQSTPVPLELVTASASGLDPHISPASVYYQLNRVAKARNLPVDQVRQLIERYTEGPDLGLFGQARVNVLQLNLALDRAS